MGDPTLSASQIVVRTAVILALIIYPLLSTVLWEAAVAGFRFARGSINIALRSLKSGMKRSLSMIRFASRRIVAVRGGSMAKEQRQELLRSAVADGTTSSNSEAEFRNDSSVDIDVRGIDAHLQLSTAGIDEVVTEEISKAPSFQSDTNNSPFFAKSISVGMGAVAADGRNQTHKSWKYGKGQLILEPGESLFINTTKSSGGISTGRWSLDYEF